MEGKLDLPKNCEVTREFKIAMYCSWGTYLPTVENSGVLTESGSTCLHLSSAIDFPCTGQIKTRHLLVAGKLHPPIQC
jgi:hypothetical protein